MFPTATYEDRRKVLPSRFKDGMLCFSATTRAGSTMKDSSLMTICTFVAHYGRMA